MEQRPVRFTLVHVLKIALIIILGLVALGLATTFVLATIQRIQKGSWDELSGILPFTDLQNSYYRGKTLWDLLDLIIIPTILAIGVFWLNQSARGVELEIANKRDEREQRNKAEQEREITLQNYLDKMTQLMLEQGLTKSAPDDPVRDVARSRTLTALRMLDGLRKGMVLGFIYEADLITKPFPILDIRGADLSGAILSRTSLFNASLNEVNLSDADIHEAVLEGVELQRANLTSANLSNTAIRWSNIKDGQLISANLSNTNIISTNFDLADLSRCSLFQSKLEKCILSDASLIHADLTEANLNDSSFFGANLSFAKLCRTKLDKANLNWIDLTGADLLDAQITQEQLLKARSVEKAQNIDNLY